MEFESNDPWVSLFLAGQVQNRCVNREMIMAQVIKKDQIFSKVGSPLPKAWRFSISLGTMVLISSLLAGSILVHNQLCNLWFISTSCTSNTNFLNHFLSFHVYLKHPTKEHIESHHTLTWKWSWKIKVGIFSKKESEPCSEVRFFLLTLVHRPGSVANNPSLPTSALILTLSLSPTPLYLSSPCPSLQSEYNPTTASPA